MKIGRSCPDCGALLVARLHEGITLDVCPSCAGVWFEQGELKALIQQDPSSLLQLEEKVQPKEVRPLGSPPAARQCPNCADPMVRYRYLGVSSVELDACPRCKGIWVDDGELARMLQALQEAEGEADREAIQPEEQAEQGWRFKGWDILLGLFRTRPIFPPETE